MSTTYRVIRERWVSGTRYLAITDEDAALVRQDRAMLDHVRPHATLDVDGYGRWEWRRPLGAADTEAARTAIREFVRGHIWRGVEEVREWIPLDDRVRDDD